MHIVCLSETKTPSRGIEGGKELHIGNKAVGGEFKWYFSTGVEQDDLDEKSKLQKAGKQIGYDLKLKTVEHAGCAIMVSSRLWHLVKDVRPICGRMMKAVVRTRPKMIIFSVYAPHAGHDVEIKEAFYSKLQDEMGRGGHRNSILSVVGGDFNARVGEPRNEEESKVIGQFAHVLCTEGERGNATEEVENVEENRALFMNWAASANLRATNTMFEHDEGATTTYQAPGRTNEAGEWTEGRCSQIDYILVNCGMGKAIVEAWSDAARNLGTDHFPVIAALQCQLQKANTTRDSASCDSILRETSHLRQDSNDSSLKRTLLTQTWASTMHGKKLTRGMSTHLRERSGQEGSTGCRRRRGE